MKPGRVGCISFAILGFFKTRSMSGYNVLRSL